MQRLSIPGFPNYSVTSTGSVIRNGSDALRPGTTKKGYKIVVLRHNGMSKTFYVHRLVALLIHPEFKSGEEVDHIDGNKSNNRVENLRIVNRSQNQIHVHELRTGVSREAAYGFHICRNCNVEKSLDEFITQTRNAKPHYYCNDCRKAINRKYYVEKVKQ